MSQLEFDPYIECSRDLAVDLVNTFDPTDGTEDLVDPAALGSFLRDHFPSWGPGDPTERELEEVRNLRWELRRVFEAADPEIAAGILNRLIADSGAHPEVTNHDGPWHLHFAPLGAPPAKRVAAEAATALAVIIASGSFDRLRSCEGVRCVDVFVDESRNRSRRYCSPSVCGNRASVKAYRARQRKQHARGS